VPTELGPEYRPEWDGQPPQMLPEDVPTWQTFRRLFGELFLRVYYNVRVGGQLIQDQGIPESVRKSWYYSTAKRVDAVAETKDEVWIIEVTANPGVRVIGQIATYRALWALDPKINKPAVAIIVADTLDQDIRFAAMVEGVRTMEV